MKNAIALFTALLLVALCAAAPAAQAGGTKKPHHEAPPTAAPVAASAEATAGARSKSTAASSAEATSTNANDSSATLNASYRDRAQAPAVSAPPVYASGPCAYGWSAGVVVPGAGLSAGRAKADPACDRRELARVLTPLNPWLALKVACGDPLVEEMLAEGKLRPEDCVYVPPTAAGVEDPPPAADYVTRPELDAALARAFKQSVRK